MRVALIMLLMFISVPFINAQKKDLKQLTVKVNEKTSKDPLVGSIVQIKSLNLFAVTDINGLAKLAVPQSGEVELEVRSLGFELQLQKIDLAKYNEVTILLEETSLSLKEVTVTAKASAAGAATSSTIGRQAIDHIQANSLKDIMELLPGQLSQINDLTSNQTLQIRSIGSDGGNNSFGAAVIIDGIPVSNNTTVGAGGSNAGSVTSGIDLRKIGTDDIESVEVIRGIPSAEYGDLTSGAVIVNTKSGATPFEIRGKVNASTLSGSVGKGFKFGKNGGSLNTNFSYVQAWGDPRTKIRSFDRINGSLSYSNNFFKKWHTSTKLRVGTLLNSQKEDPDQVKAGIFEEQKDLSVSFSHDGKISINKRLSRLLNYAVGITLSQNESSKSSIVNANGSLPILTATTSGYYPVEVVTKSYLATGGSKSTPRSIFGKVGNQFHANWGPWKNNIKFGIDYRYDSNSGIGVYNEDNQRPLRPNSNGRPRPFYDIPALSQLSGYLEDNMNIHIADRRLNLSVGARYTHIQPGMEEAVWSISPRINGSIQLFDWMSVRGGFGISSKTPSLAHLYPDKNYTDRYAGSFYYYNQGLTGLQKIDYYHTNVYDVKRSENLKNSESKKFEFGIDFRLNNNRSINLVYYNDKSLGGFGSIVDPRAYLSNYYTQVAGGYPTLPSGMIPTLDNPLIAQLARVDTVWSSTGRIGNTQASQSQGIELEAELGRISAINTSFFFSAAFNETKSYTNGIRLSSPNGFQSDISLYPDVNTVPYKVEYSDANSKNINRMVSANFRAVHNISQLGLVASLSTQFVFYNFSETTNQRKVPQAIYRVDKDLNIVRTPVTEEMLNDPNYVLAVTPKKTYYLRDEIVDPKNSPASESPVTWNMNMRISKDISKIASLSFYATNFMFIEPWKSGSNSSTLVERNTGNFSFGMEIMIKL